MINSKDRLTIILKIALWRNEGISNKDIRTLLKNECSEKVLKSGIKLYKFLSSGVILK